MTTATKTEIPQGTYAIDRAHSSASFEVTHNQISTFRAGFTDIDATLTAEVDGRALAGAVRAESIDVTEPTEFRSHLLSPEFFDVERFPEVRFASSDIDLSDDGALTLRGELTVNDTAHALEARGSIRGPVVGPDGADRVALDLETTVDRNDLGLGWNMDLPDGRKVLEDDVRLIVHLELIKE
jgi:polyisoprenoid-binding protein YceI